MRWGVLSALALAAAATLLWFGSALRDSFAGVGDGSAAFDADGTPTGDASIGGLRRRSASQIQDRIDRAAPGAVILVEPGHYEGSIDFRGRPIVLRSRDGADRTILDGAGANAPVVTIRGVRQGVDPQIEGFTIRGARGGSATGLLIEACDPIVARCRIMDNEGGGATIVRSRVLFDECAFVGNHAAPFGGALQSVDASPVLMSCSFDRNRALTAGGALHLRGGAPMMARCRFTGNRTVSGAWGGGIFAEGAELTVIDSEFLGNGSTDGGGAVFVRGGRARIDRCAFEGNSAGAAWALGCDGAIVEVGATRFCGDRASNLGDGVLEGRGNEFDAACARDCNGNGVPDQVEIAQGHAEDCNRNGLIDECEIADGTAEDLDFDLIPDDCGR